MQTSSFTCNMEVNVLTHLIRLLPYNVGKVWKALYNGLLIYILLGAISVRINTGEIVSESSDWSLTLCWILHTYPRYLLQYQEPIPCEQLVTALCDIKQAYTQFGGNIFSLSNKDSRFGQLTHRSIRLYQNARLGHCSVLEFPAAYTENSLVLLKSNSAATAIHPKLLFKDRVDSSSISAVSLDLAGDIRRQALMTVTPLLVRTADCILKQQKYRADC